MNKEFRIGDLFTSQNGNTDLKKEHINGRGYPVVSSGLENTGIIGLTDIDARILPRNTITVDMFGNVFFRDFEYKLVTHARVFSLIPKGYRMGVKKGLYVVSMLSWLSRVFSYNNMCSYKKIENMPLSLPVIESSDPNHEYTVNDIDWQYMEDRIKELEEDRIKELEAYLKATNLDDYELTDEDKKILSLSRKSALNKNSSLETDCQNGQVRFREFKIVDIFEVKNTKCFMQSDVIFGSGDTPYVTASDRNNSIMTYIECSPEQVDEGHCIFIGGKTLTFSYQDQDFVSNDSHNLALYLKRQKTLSRHAYMYMISSLQKSLKSKYYWGDSISNKKIQKDTFFLPVTPDGEPDFVYMEHYIRTIEKLTIADVVKYKSKVIDTTKMLVNSEP